MFLQWSSSVNQNPFLSIFLVIINFTLRLPPLVVTKWLPMPPRWLHTSVSVGRERGTQGKKCACICTPVFPSPFPPSSLPSFSTSPLPPPLPSPSPFLLPPLLLLCGQNQGNEYQVSFCLNTLRFYCCCLVIRSCPTL